MNGMSMLAAALLALGGPALLAQQPSFHGGPRRAPERLVKETRADGSLVLDESGLTHGFEQIKKMLRSIATLEAAGGTVEVHTPRLPQISLDYRNFEQLESGIVEFQLEAAIKLRTERALRFGEVTVAPGNVAPDYPGLYSLWLRKVSADDWRLLFNRESDAWGTMHDPTADVGEVQLAYVRGAAGSPTLSVQIEPSGDGGRLVFAWGPHTWSVPFSAVVGVPG